MKILVTGGAGFIGSHLVERYMADGHEVIILDDLSSGKRTQVPGNIRLVVMDVRDPNISSLFEKEKFDVVNHHAAQVSVNGSMHDPFLDASVNILGTLRLLDCVRTYGVKRFILAASGGTYYGESEKPASETDLGGPTSAYGLSKLAAERYVQFYAKQFKFDYTVFRYANIYGPRQDPHGEAGVVAIFADLLLKGEAPSIFGSGDQSRDFTYVGDVAAANSAALEGPNGVFNIGTGERTSVNALLAEMQQGLGTSVAAVKKPARSGELMHSCLSYALAQKALGWKPTVSLREGLKNTLQSFKPKT